MPRDNDPGDSGGKPMRRWWHRTYCDHAARRMRLTLGRPGGGPFFVFEIERLLGFDEITCSTLGTRKYLAAEWRALRTDMAFYKAQAQR